MNKHILYLLLAVTWLGCFAKNESPTPVPYSPKRLAESNRDTIHQKIYDTDYFTEDGTVKPAPAGIKVKQNGITATLFVDPFLERPSATAFSITLECRFSYKTIASPSTINTKTARLTINYDPASATYKAKDYFTLPNATWADVAIIKVTSAPAMFAENDTTFRLYLQYQADKFIVPTSSQLSQALTVIDFKSSFSNGYLKLNWQRPEPDWAERYDIEYLFIDNYNGTGGVKPASALAYDFRFNATRVSTANNELEIPMVFEQGYVLARVRAVGMQGALYDEPVYGVWDMATSANSLPTDNKHVYQVTAALAHEGDKINWQYTGAFSGDDLHKESVGYMDGTMRSRQWVSTAACQQNLIVTETIYDHQGRPAIQTLPAPVKPANTATATPAGSSSGTGTSGGISPSGFLYNPSLILGNEYRLTLTGILDIFGYRSTQPRIGFQKNFNQNSSGQPYSRQNFDADRDNVCNAGVDPFNTNSGAAKYYSCNNPDLSGYNKYIPDAEGYPFTQTTYTPDKTNRPAMLAKAGASLRVGSNHEQKFLYGTPAQQELDRMFGNNAGTASRYKKEMLLDENGQARITYKDIKGNVVATALAGDAPAVYEAIPQGDAANITLHLIEEDNRLDEASQSLVSQKSLLLSKTTTLNFSYRLTPPTLTGTYCNGISFCYDCVYDLEITVRNACGDSVWGRRQAIGTLTPLNACNATELSFSGSATALPAGNYFISKRLTVNATALQQYISDYKTRYVCAQPLQAYLPAAGLAAGQNACSQPCNQCASVPIATGRTYALTQPDGSTRMVSLPVTQRGTGNGDCVRYCNQQTPSPCATALEAMLADLSPGGQYAEYMDTTRRDVANPRGVFNAKTFVLSVLNDSANSLPVRNSNWRNPVYDYQNKDGSIAYIEIGNDGLPAHSEIDIVMRDGKQYVKPRYLAYAADFIRYWQPQWAEALVVYHPEYAYYSWCINNTNSYNYDTLLKATSTYNDALVRSLTNHLDAGVAIDPFFRDGLPADASAMNTSLNNFAPLAGYANLNIEEAVYMAVHCNNINFNAADANTCARGKRLYLNPATADKEWNFYKEFYLLKKHLIHDAARKNWIAANGFFINAQIGTNSFGTVANALYADRVKRFNNSNDAFTYLPVDIDTASSETLYAWRDAAMLQMRQTCGGCNAGIELSTFLNALVSEKKLQQSLSLPSVTPLFFSKGMTRLFSDSLAMQYNWATTATANTLQFTVSTTRGTQCVINLAKSAAYNWDSIIRLDCFTALSASTFTMRARTANDSVFTINGSSTCINFTACPPATVCTKQPAADAMAVLMKYLFQRNRYRSTALLLRGRSGYTPHFAEALRSTFPAATRWEWKMKTISAPDTALTAEIAVTNPARSTLGSATAYLPQAGIERCNFTLRVITPGFRLSQVADIIDISKPKNATGCNVNEFVLTAITAGGVQFQIYGQSCYKLYDCCNTQQPRQPEVICCIPVMPKFDVVPTCLRDAEAVANNNRAHDAADRLTAATDSFRIKYMARCLSAAEQLNASYNDAIYQITLLYYDRSSQLVKTVPPMGVRLLTASELTSVGIARSSGSGGVYPAHSMATTYRYNSFNQLIEKSTPDEGTTRYCYDQNGRALMSQNAVQLSSNTCSYTLYDDMGRVQESGKRTHTGAIPYYSSYESFKAATLAATRTEFKMTRYDEMPAAAVSRFPAAPKYLRNRMAGVEAYETAGNLEHAMYFDYDVAGNTKNIIQHFKGIATGDASKFWKKVSYDYNAISGKIKRMWYQKGNTDQLIHWYQYDADGKMISAQTGTNPTELELLRETDARYFYYPHGYLARIEVGTEKIQGIDYAYTINGALKAINSGNASKDFDIGEDGKPEGDLYGHFPTDVFGEVLNYFPNDYQSISSSGVAFSPATSGALESGFSMPLYNGYIRNTISAIPAIDAKPVARAYKYDQACRLNEMQLIFEAGAVTSNAISGSFTNDYKMQLTYDANGNIKTLLRNKDAGAAMDNLSYQYTSGKNQLTSIDDVVGIGADTKDLDDQAAANYTYDACGRLRTDAAAGISEIVWNNNGNIKRINQSGGVIDYGYDALNRRAWKKNGSNTEFYVRDATGKSLANYRISGGAITCTALDIYGEARLGQYQLNKLTEPTTSDTGSFIRGLKRYEIANHIGNVQAIVSDKRKLVSGVVQADVVTATDYYPFGMPMPNRAVGNRAYSYGFQGMECNDDMYADDNAYNTDFRQYDPRVGRWLSVDPKADKYYDLTPYNAFLNNPENRTDAKGDDPPYTLAQYREEHGINASGMYEVLRTDDAGNLVIYAVRPGDALPGHELPVEFRYMWGAGAELYRTLSGDGWMNPYIENGRMLTLYHMEISSRVNTALDFVGEIAGEVMDADDVDTRGIRNLSHAIEGINRARALHDAPEQVAALIDAYENLEVYARQIEAHPEDAGRLLLQRAQEFDRILTNSAALLSAMGVDLPPGVSDLLERGDIITTFATIMFNHVIQLDGDTELHREARSWISTERVPVVRGGSAPSRK